MPENEAKRCFMRSLSYWSHKTLESNMSPSGYKQIPRSSVVSLDSVDERATK